MAFNQDDMDAFSDSDSISSLEEVTQKVITNKSRSKGYNNYKNRNKNRNNSINKKERSPDEITKKLEGYKLLQNMSDITTIIIPGHFIRYFIVNNDKEQTKSFRLGGIVNFVDDEGRYLRLQSASNSSIKWSVQLQANDKILEPIIYYKDYEKEKTALTKYSLILNDNFDLIDKMIKVLGGKDYFTRVIDKLETEDITVIDLLRENKILKEKK